MALKKWFKKLGQRVTRPSNSNSSNSNNSSSSDSSSGSEYYSASGQAPARAAPQTRGEEETQRWLDNDPNALDMLQQTILATSEEVIINRPGAEAQQPGTESQRAGQDSMYQLQGLAIMNLPYGLPRGTQWITPGPDSQQPRMPRTGFSEPILRVVMRPVEWVTGRKMIYPKTYNPSRVDTESWDDTSDSSSDISSDMSSLAFSNDSTEEALATLIDLIRTREVPGYLLDQYLPEPENGESSAQGAARERGQGSGTNATWYEDDSDDEDLVSRPRSLSSQSFIELPEQTQAPGRPGSKDGECGKESVTESTEDFSDDDSETSSVENVERVDEEPFWQCLRWHEKDPKPSSTCVCVNCKNWTECGISFDTSNVPTATRGLLVLDEPDAGHAMYQGTGKALVRLLCKHYSMPEDNDARVMQGLLCASVTLLFHASALAKRDQDLNCDPDDLYGQICIAAYQVLWPDRHSRRLALVSYAGPTPNLLNGNVDTEDVYTDVRKSNWYKYEKWEQLHRPKSDRRGLPRRPKTDYEVGAEVTRALVKTRMRGKVNPIFNFLKAREVGIETALRKNKHRTHSTLRNEVLPEDVVDSLGCEPTICSASCNVQEQRKRAWSP